LDGFVHNTNSFSLLENEDLKRKNVLAGLFKRRSDRGLAFQKLKIMDSFLLLIGQDLQRIMM
jgi:hypothetical protein